MERSEWKVVTSSKNPGYEVVCGDRFICWCETRATAEAIVDGQNSRYLVAKVSWMLDSFTSKEKQNLKGIVNKLSSPKSPLDVGLPPEYDFSGMEG